MDHSQIPARASILHFLPPKYSVPTAAYRLQMLAVLDCSISGTLPLNVLSQGFSCELAERPEHAEFVFARSTSPHALHQQWHLGLEYQLPADSVLEISYGGSRGLKAVRFLQCNQAVPDPKSSGRSCSAAPPKHDWPGGSGGPCSLATQGQYCNPALDAAIDTLRSNAQSNYDSLQVRLEKRYSHGLQYEASYTFAHASTTLPAPAWDR